MSLYHSSQYKSVRGQREGAHPISASVLSTCEFSPDKYPFGSIVLDPAAESVICSSLIESIFSLACPISAKSVIAFAGVSSPKACCVVSPAPDFAKTETYHLLRVEGRFQRVGVSSADENVIWDDVTSTLQSRFLDSIPDQIVHLRCHERTASVVRYEREE